MLEALGEMADKHDDRLVRIKNGDKLGQFTAWKNGMRSSYRSQWSEMLVGHDECFKPPEAAVKQATAEYLKRQAEKNR